VVAFAALLVLSALLYGSAAGRDDVVAINVAELLVVGAIVGGVRTWRGRRGII
jgi:hypothetical protein